VVKPTGDGRSDRNTASWAFAVAGGLWLLAAVPFLTNPGDLAPLLFAAAGLLIGLAWLCVLLIPPHLPRSAGEACRWASVPLAGLLGLAAVSGPGLMLRVALCERQLTAYVAGVPPGTGGIHPPKRVGLFSVDETEEYQGIVLLYTDSGFLDRFGVAYVPPGKGPPQVFKVRFSHLYGPWYRFRWKF
jgi:hypothetical protein